jgi:gamma-glutamylcyclotransferase (GGCT)/AIG2-like uncharacterized protein YtfP
MPPTESRSPLTTSVSSGPMDRLSAEPEALFVYGSLLFPEVISTLIDRVPPATSATVAGWRVAALPGRVYPILVPAEATATGKLISDLTAAEWRVLDAFEDKVYELYRLAMTDGRHGWAYVSRDVAEASSDDWNIDRFAELDLEAYLKRCAAWRERYEAAKSNGG